jgi:hypothetical protein
LAFALTSTTPGGYSNVKGGHGVCTDLEELWLMAQSVPSASRIPCVQASSADMVGNLRRVTSGQSVLDLVDPTNPKVGGINVGDEPQASPGGVTIRLAATCEIQTQGEGRIVAPGVRRFQVEGVRGTPEVVDVFPGGCVTYQLNAGAAAALVDQAKRAVTFRTRDDLREALRRRSNGRLELDPQVD